MKTKISALVGVGTLLTAISVFEVGNSGVEKTSLGQSVMRSISDNVKFDRARSSFQVDGFNTTKTRMFGVDRVKQPLC